MGWDLSTDKLVPYAECCKVLGVELILTKTPSGSFDVCNTQTRAEELIQSISGILKDGYLSKSDGEKLRGRLQFASNQLFGRRFRNCLQELNLHLARNLRALSPNLEAALKLIVHLLSSNIPRTIGTGHANWFHLYVDASFEPDGFSGVGGLLLAPSGTCIGCFSEVVTKDLLKALMRPDQETPIMELEALAIYVGVSLFENLVNDARLVVFTDNQSAQASVVKCKSNNHNVDLIIRGICSLEEKLNTVCWIERVPSYSNPADVLSREEILAYKGVNRSRMDLLQAWERCREEITPSLISGGGREAVCDL